jgi:TonB family protein
MSAVALRLTELPWSSFEDDDERFREILKRVGLAVLLLSLLLPFLPIPQIERAKLESVPERLAKLVIEKKPLPPPPAPVVREEPKLAKTEPKPREIKKEPKPARTEQARDRARRSGLLALSDELESLRSRGAPGPIGAETRLTRGNAIGAGHAPGASERAIITARAGSGSGGIRTSGLSRDTGGGGLAGRGTTRLASSIGGGGGGGGSLSRGGGGKPARSIEEIQLVFDRNKRSIFALYNRALREDPTLAGKVVLKLTIQPNGEVTVVAIVSSELKAPELERKLAARIRQFDFGAKDVDTMVVTYPIDFLPS